MTRVSRRTLLAGAAAAVGSAAALAAVRLRLSPAPASPPSPTSPPAASPAAPPQPTPLPRGGTVALALASSLDFDVYDALRTGEPAVIELLGRIHARLLQWSDPATAELGADLAASHEQPDAATLILRLDDRARWHPGAPLEGRPVSAADVRLNLQRWTEAARAGDTLAGRRLRPCSDIVRIEVPAPGTLLLHLEGPSPLLLQGLAGEFALVQPPDIVDRFDPADPLDPALLAGCGPWQFEEFDGPGTRLRAHASGHRAPLLDQLVLSPPVDVVERYRAGTLDEFPAFDPRDAIAARALPGVGELAMFAREPVISSFALAGPPWSDPRLIEAIAGALHRSWLVSAMFGGRASPSGPLPPVYAAAPARDSLAALPGLGPDPAADAADARQRWEAAGGPSLGTVTVEFPAILDPRYAASAHVVSRLNDVLGPQFRPAIETYPVISQRVQEGAYGNGRAAFWFGWGAPLPSPDPREAVLELYGHALDLAARERIFSSPPSDTSLLRELLLDLLAPGRTGVVPWVQQVYDVFRRPGTGGPRPSPFWDGHRDVQRYRIP